MHVSLTPQMEDLIKQKVASGMYNNASEVVREALRLFEEKERFNQARLDALRQDIREGINSGASVPFNIQEIIKEAQSKHGNRH